ncbi:MAG: class I SAM-dependent methyltransferase [bacterium]|jgi:predicted O-methyltransferase YrrM
MNTLWQIVSYLIYRAKSITRFGVHSPFVYELVEKVLRDKSRYDDYPKLHHVHKKYARRKDRIETIDFGSSAGHKEYIVRISRVGKLVRKRSHQRSQLELLYRLARYFKPRTILEFGTAAGISALYFGKGSPDSRIITMEGCMGLASVAQKNLKKRNIQAEVEIGEFSAILDKVLERLERLDMVFLDGNHRKKPTLEYFEKCSAKANEESVFLLDDIHWSPGMESAWRAIKKDKRVSVTIDLYWMGLVFFRKGIEKQNFIIRY